MTTKAPLILFPAAIVVVLGSWLPLPGGLAHADTGIDRLRRVVVGALTPSNFTAKLSIRCSKGSASDGARALEDRVNTGGSSVVARPDDTSSGETFVLRGTLIPPSQETLDTRLVAREMSMHRVYKEAESLEAAQAQGPDARGTWRKHSPGGDTTVALLLGKPVLTNAHLADARVVQDPNGFGPNINMEFTPQGAKILAEMTRAAVNEKVALVVDGEVLMAPVVREEITRGTVVLTMGNSADQGAVERTQSLAGSLRWAAIGCTVSIREFSAKSIDEPPVPSPTRTGD